jgi:hypothetical protein
LDISTQTTKRRFALNDTERTDNYLSDVAALTDTARSDDTVGAISAPLARTGPEQSDDAALTNKARADTDRSYDNVRTEMARTDFAACSDTTGQIGTARSDDTAPNDSAGTGSK